MRATLGILVAGFGLLMSATPVLAHHSFSAEFDDKQPVSLKGTVTKVDWMNPHIWIYISAKDEGGKAPSFRPDSDEAGRDRVAPHASSRLNTMDALVPPKPNELDSTHPTATLSRRSRTIGMSANS